MGFNIPSAMQGHIRTKRPNFKLHTQRFVCNRVKARVTESRVMRMIIIIKAFLKAWNPMAICVLRLKVLCKQCYDSTQPNLTMHYIAESAIQETLEQYTTCLNNA